MSEKAPVIIIEHDRALRVMYRAILTSLKIPNPVLFFDKGTEVIEFLKGAPVLPRLVLVNASLPRMKGIELKRKLNGMGGLIPRIPFMILCESCSDSEIANAKELGVDDIIKESDNYEILRARLERILNVSTMIVPASIYSEKEIAWLLDGDTK